jgi:hypothetical protein
MGDGAARGKRGIHAHPEGTVIAKQDAPVSITDADIGSPERRDQGPLSAEHGNAGVPQIDHRQSTSGVHVHSHSILDLGRAFARPSDPVDAGPVRGEPTDTVVSIVDEYRSVGTHRECVDLREQELDRAIRTTEPDDLVRNESVRE